MPEEETMNGKQVKLVHALVALVILTVTATAGAMVYFADKDMVQEVKSEVKDNREEIAAMNEQAKFEIFLDRLTEIEDDCLDRTTGDWKCTAEEKQKYDRLRLHIEMLKKELGIEELEF